MIFRLENTSFLKAEVTKDGLIKTTQVIKSNDGSIPTTSLNDPGKVFNKDIPFKDYKGLVYALPTEENVFITVFFPSLMAKNYTVGTRKVTKL